MSGGKLGRREEQQIEKLVAEYAANQDRVKRFLNQLLVLLRESKELSKLVHSFRSRVKAESSLRDKLSRKFIEARAAGMPISITPENLLVKINDLAGLPVLHLHPRQIKEIDGHIRSLLVEEKLDLCEEPFARTWDGEYRKFSRSVASKTQESPSLYTSVHYVVESSSRKTTTCEIQVRTLMEEVWGEVEHSINYPHRIDCLACREQLKVLARVTSSATRLVDSIFLTFEEHRERNAR